MIVRYATGVKHPRPRIRRLRGAVGAGGQRLYRHRRRSPDLRRDIARTSGDLTEWDNHLGRLTEEHAARAAASVAWKQRPREFGQPQDVIVHSPELADEHARPVLDALDGPSRRRTEHCARELAVLEVGLR